MSWIDDTVSATVAVLGSGVVAKGLSKYLDYRKAKARAEEKRVEAEAGIASKALDIVEDQREDAKENADGWRECEKRCAELAAENTSLRERMERLESTVGQYVQRCEQLERNLAAERAAREAAQNALGNELQKVVLLEAQAEALIGELTEVRDSIAAQRPDDQTAADTDPPPAERMVGLRVVEQVVAPRKDRGGPLR